MRSPMLPRTHRRSSPDRSPARAPTAHAACAGVTVRLSLVFSERFAQLLSARRWHSTAPRDKITENLGVFMRMGLMLQALRWPSLSCLRNLALRRTGHFAAGPLDRAAGYPLRDRVLLRGGGVCLFCHAARCAAFPANLQGIPSELRPASTLSFITNVMFWIGLSFEFPLVIFILSSMGFVKPGTCCFPSGGWPSSSSR